MKFIVLITTLLFLQTIWVGAMEKEEKPEIFKDMSLPSIKDITKYLTVEDLMKLRYLNKEIFSRFEKICGFEIVEANNWEQDDYYYRAYGTIPKGDKRKPHIYYFYHYARDKTVFDIWLRGARWYFKLREDGKVVDKFGTLYEKPSFFHWNYESMKIEVSVGSPHIHLYYSDENNEKQYNSIQLIAHLVRFYSSINRRRIEMESYGLQGYCKDINTSNPFY